MQSGRGNIKKWILEFEVRDPTVEPLMGWESSDDTLSEVKLEFFTKEQALDYAKKNNIEYKLIEIKKKILLLNHTLTIF